MPKDTPDIIVEIKGGCVIAVYARKPLRKLSVELLDWDNLSTDDRDEEQAHDLTRTTGRMVDILGGR